MQDSELFCFLSKLHRPKKLLKITEDKTRLSNQEDKDTDGEELPKRNISWLDRFKLYTKIVQTLDSWHQTKQSEKTDMLRQKQKKNIQSTKPYPKLQQHITV